MTVELNKWVKTISDIFVHEQHMHAANQSELITADYRKDQLKKAGFDKLTVEDQLFVMSTLAGGLMTAGTLVATHLGHRSWFLDETPDAVTKICDPKMRNNRDDMLVPTEDSHDQTTVELVELLAAMVVDQVAGIDMEEVRSTFHNDGHWRSASPSTKAEASLTAFAAAVAVLYSRMNEPEREWFEEHFADDTSQMASLLLLTRSIKEPSDLVAPPVPDLDQIKYVDRLVTLFVDTIRTDGPSPERIQNLYLDIDTVLEGCKEPQAVWMTVVWELMQTIDRKSDYGTELDEISQTGGRLAETLECASFITEAH